MKKSQRFLPYIVFGGILFLFFFDFFTRGYVLDGHVDRRSLTLPFQMYYLRSFQNIQIPQWNPYIFCGKSALAQAGLTFFYPVIWLVYALPEHILPATLTVSAMLHFFLTGGFMYLFLRKIIDDRYWALCGTLVYWLALPVVTTMAQGTAFHVPFLYLPLLVYLIYTFPERTIFANFLFHSTVLALFLLGGFIQTNIYIMSLYGFLALFLSPPGFRGFREYMYRIFTIAASAAFACAIAAIRYVPFYVKMRLYLKEHISYSEFLATGVTPPLALLKVFMPQFFGSRLGKELAAPFLLKLNPNEIFLCYGGVFGIFLSLYGLCFLWKKEALVWKAVVGSIFLVILGSPLAYAHYLATGKTMAFFGRVAWLLPFALAVLFSMAGKTVLRNQKHCIGFTFFAVGITLAVSILGVVAYSILAINQELSEASLFIMRASEFYFAGVSILLIMLFIFLLLSTSPKKQIVFKVSFLSILVADLLCINLINFQSLPALSGIMHLLSPPSLFAANQVERQVASEFAQRRDFRILAQSQNTAYDRNIVLDIYQNSGYDNTPPDLITRLYTQSTSPPEQRQRIVLPTTLRMMQLTATKYMVADNMIAPISPTLPRYSLYNRYQVIPDEEQTLQILQDESFDIHSSVLLNVPPDLVIPEGTPAGDIHLLEEQNHALVFDVTTEQNALLMLNDTYDEGWQARIDDEPAQVLRANYAFRAVAVPKGTHRVALQFFHPGLKEGKMMTTIAVIVWLCLWIWYVNKKQFWKYSRQT